MAVGPAEPLEVFVVVVAVLGGSWVAIRVPLRVPLKGSLGILEGVQDLGPTWRFMGSYK